VAFAGLNPGWNLGNTLDATPDEGDWGNPAVSATTLQQIQAKGFKSIRIPGLLLRESHSGAI
jgi:endoglucanase